MIAAFIGVLAGGLGLVALLDTVIPGNLTETVLNGIWHVLQVLITPIIDLLGLIWGSITDFIRNLFGF